MSLKRARMTSGKIQYMALSTTPPQVTDNASSQYLELLKKTLTYGIYADREMRESLGPERVINAVQYGTGFLAPAHTMLGLERLNLLHTCIDTIASDATPGSMIQTGVWRGGGLIFMAAAARRYGLTRLIYGLDSFQGLPKQDHVRFPRESCSIGYEAAKALIVLLDDVIETIGRYGFGPAERHHAKGIVKMGGGIRLVPGWFETTLKKLRTETWSLAHLDGDLYSSTWTALSEIYPRMNPGGYVIVDDYLSVEGCKRAVEDFVERLPQRPEIMACGPAVFWRKPRETNGNAA